jgi:hypothetical protein
VPIEKKGTRKIRVCVDFRDPNWAMLKDEYLMPVADVLINNALATRLSVFWMGMQVIIRYSWPRMTSQKLPFAGPGFVGLFEWVVMTFRLKMNPLKCAFGVSAGRFLGLVVNERGIEIDPKKVEVIGRIQEPT